MTKCRECESRKFYDKLLGKNPNLVKNNTKEKVFKRFNMLIKKAHPRVHYGIDQDDNVIAKFEFTVKNF